MLFSRLSNAFSPLGVLDLKGRLYYNLFALLPVGKDPEMARIQLAAFDLDGTLLKEDKMPSPYTLETLERVLDRGVEVVLASGRSRGIIPRVLLDNPRIRYVISCNGALIWDLREKRAVFEELVPYSAALDILRRAREYDCVREASVEGMMYVSEYDVETEIQRIFPNLREIMHTLRTPVPDVEDFFAERGVGAEKLLFFFPSSESREPLRRWIAGRYDLALTSSHPLALEVNAPGISKGSALRQLTRRLGVAPEHVFAIGDSENDGEMIAFAGTGVAMGNAEAPVLALTDLVTADNDSDGAALAMEKWILNKN